MYHFFLRFFCAPFFLAVFFFLAVVFVTFTEGALGTAGATGFFGDALFLRRDFFVVVVLIFTVCLGIYLTIPADEYVVSALVGLLLYGYLCGCLFLDYLELALIDYPTDISTEKSDD